jgi:hypothetical protein
MLGGDIEKFLYGLWLIMAEFMYQGSVASTGPEHRDDVGVIDLWEFVALLGEPSNVVPKEFTRLLSASLHNPEVAWPHVRTLEVTSEDLLDIF